LKNATAGNHDAYNPTNPFWKYYLDAKAKIADIEAQMVQLQAMQQADVASPQIAFDDAVNNNNRAVGHVTPLPKNGFFEL